MSTQAPAPGGDPGDERSLLRITLISLALVPLFVLAGLFATAVALVGAVLDLGDGEGGGVDLEAVQLWGQEHLLLLAVINSAALIPGALYLALRSGRLSRRQLGLGLDRPVAIYLLGTVLGMGILLVPALIGYQLGGFTAVTEGAEGGPQGMAALGGIVFVLPGLMLASFAEELVLRGLLLSLWAPKLGTAGAVLATSLLFAVLHLGNPGASALGGIGAFIAGIWLGLAFLTSRNLFFASGLHLGWNAAVAVVLGLPVSGVALPSLLRWTSSSDPAVQRLWGGDYGPEEGLVFHLALSLAVVSSLIIGPMLRQEPTTTPD